MKVNENDLIASRLPEQSQANLSKFLKKSLKQPNADSARKEGVQTKFVQNIVIGLSIYGKNVKSFLIYRV